MFNGMLVADTCFNLYNCGTFSTTCTRDVIVYFRVQKVT